MRRPITLTWTLALGLLGAALHASDASTEALMRQTQCFACHAVNKKVVGPAYRDVARRYRGKKGAMAKLCQKVKDGGAGAWGQVPMSPHPQLSDAEIKAMVLWVLKRK